eukprot:gnl/TRDRNA2_/TRDRNA2_46442_c0_seq1.p1 gnl/TRDRNA2_/TRDRNA2_46442_c0~~gnl/TRDRNA2_/TRDRNA2_46442_c0_seq1.p1  ORF type:complete len:485 (+),score=61.60 gnl/TRDRNA2_/TRDRNA2_46442_c0_seq1:92-1546(+)
MMHGVPVISLLSSCLQAQTQTSKLLLHRLGLVAGGVEIEEHATHPKGYSEQKLPDRALKLPCLHRRALEDTMLLKDYIPPCCQRHRCERRSYSFIRRLGIRNWSSPRQQIIPAMGRRRSTGHNFSETHSCPPWPPGGPRPRWLQQSISAVPLTSQDDGSVVPFSTHAEGCHSAFGTGEPPGTFVEASFRYTGDAHGKQVLVKRALVDTGSGDSELSEGLLSQIVPDLVPSKRKRYETTTGHADYDVYDLELSIDGRTCMTKVGRVPEQLFAKDAGKRMAGDAVIGHAALAQLGFVVDPAARRLVHRTELKQSLQQEDKEEEQEDDEDDREDSVDFNYSSHSSSQDDEDDSDSNQSNVEDLFTYIKIRVRSTLHGGSERRVRALVDTGSTDSELGSRIIRSLQIPLPVVADDAVYEIATGQIVVSVYEAQLTVLNRTCAAAVTASLSPSQVPILGHAAMAALRLIIDPAKRRVIRRDGSTFDKAS